MEKFEYRCTTRNLTLCNGTIIVLKIALLHGVFIITNFVIAKHDIKINITLFRLQRARDPRSTPYLAFLHPVTFFDPMSSFATGAGGY